MVPKREAPLTLTQPIEENPTLAPAITGPQSEAGLAQIKHVHCPLAGGFMRLAAKSLSDLFGN